MKNFFSTSKKFLSNFNNFNKTNRQLSSHISNCNYNLNINSSNFNSLGINKIGLKWFSNSINSNNNSNNSNNNNNSKNSNNNTNKKNLKPEKEKNSKDNKNEKNVKNDNKDIKENTNEKSDINIKNNQKNNKVNSSNNSNQNKTNISKNKNINNSSTFHLNKNIPSFIKEADWTQDTENVDTLTPEELLEIENFTNRANLENNEFEFSDKFKERESEKENKEKNTGDNNNNNDSNNELLPLIYFYQPILPYNQITIHVPNKMDLFFGLILKYGKIKVIDEETTLIQDICLFNEKEEMLKNNNINGKQWVYGTKCEILYKKGKLEIKGLDCIYKIKTLKPGKYKFFNVNDAIKYDIGTPAMNFINYEQFTSNLLEKSSKQQKSKLQSFLGKFHHLNAYLDKCHNYFKNIMMLTDTINKNLELDENFFGDNNQSFLFKYQDISNMLEFYNSENVSNTLTNVFDEFKLASEDEEFMDYLNKENKEDKFEQNNDQQQEEQKPNKFHEKQEYLKSLIDDSHFVISKYFDDLIKFQNYFTLKTHIIYNAIYSNPNELENLQNFNDLQEKLFEIDLLLEKVNNFIDLKYNVYKFSKRYRLNVDNPMANKTEEEKKLINKYKEAYESKISEVDQIEKEKENISQKLAQIKNMSDEVRETIEKELNKISGVNYESENGKRFEYLNHIISLPWDQKDTPKWDINYAKNVLDENLYGLQETKQRIYEFIAKNMRTNNQKGCVLLLSGGPGTGKTRIAKLIGEALQRKVGFISLAGISDGKTILGFKRTYISSTPGVFIREMQKVNTTNPVIVIDEIDKINLRYGTSSVYNALLQLMNPEENHRFQDHYLELPFDFSNVIFILTSNNNEIFAPLLDRMEVIKIDPYVYYEKFLIAKNYALKQILKEYHMENLEITDRALYELIYTYCKNEAGVRKLKKLLENIVRKITAKIELGELSNMIKKEINDGKMKEDEFSSNSTLEEEVEIQNKYLKYLQINSNNIFKIVDENNTEDSVLANIISNRHKLGEYGMCIGLFVSKTENLNSWGDASIFSVYLQPKKNKKIEYGDQLKNYEMKKIYNNNEEENMEELLNGKFEHPSSNLEEEIKNAKLENNNKANKDKDSKDKDVSLLKQKSLKYEVVSTGNLGEDSIQSLNIALDLAGEYLLKINKKKYENYFIHKEIHYDCPQILQPKSGPSAGVVNFLSCMSAALKTPIIPNIAMTGEVSIEGYVLKIGGVKEKCQGAQRYGVMTLVLPIGNKNDFMDLQPNLKNSFKRVFFAKSVDEIYEIGFDGDVSEIDCFEGNIENSVINLERENYLQNNLIDKLF
jgi:ATP-dependent Lon protease